MNNSAVKNGRVISRLVTAHKLVPFTTRFQFLVLALQRIEHLGTDQNARNSKLIRRTDKVI
jgi:hypothetical protein